MKTLTWKVNYTRPTPCPDYKPDPYTGQYPNVHCAVYHFETVTEDKVSQFQTEQEALDFASKAPDSCHDFMLDGKLIEDKRPKVENITISGGLVGNGTTTLGGANTLNYTHINS